MHFRSCNVITGVSPAGYTPILLTKQSDADYNGAGNTPILKT